MQKHKERSPGDRERRERTLLLVFYRLLNCIEECCGGMIASQSMYSWTKAVNLFASQSYRSNPETWNKVVGGAQDKWLTLK